MNRFLISLFAAVASLSLAAADKSIVLIAGTPSHAPGDHEFRAGSILLAGCLNRIPGIHATVVSNPGVGSGHCEPTFIKMKLPVP